MNEVLNAIYSRRSVRAFECRDVEREKLHEIVKAALYAPTAMNQQKWHFTVITNKLLLTRLNEAVKKFMMNSGNPQLQMRASASGYCFYYDAPALIVPSFAPDAIYVSEDCGCAIENMYLAAHSLGLGSCWINQLSGAVADDEEVRAVLGEAGVPKTNAIRGSIAIGYGVPAGERTRVGTFNFAE